MGKEQSSSNKWCDTEDLLVYSGIVLEPVTSRRVKHAQLVDTDTEPNSGRIALFVLVKPYADGGL